MSEINLSVVIPTHRENDDSFLLKMAMTYPQTANIEYLVIDHGTEDFILKQINRSDFHILKTQLKTRAARLNAGFHAAKGEIVVFHHPRSLIESDAFQHLLENHSQISWGGFTHAFDQQHPGLQWTSWYSNKVRPRLSKIVYLDHCIFFKKHLLTKDIPDIPIFEDTELSYLLAKSGPPQILPFQSITSSVRFKKNGFFKQALINQKMKILFHLGRSKNKMNEEYEKNLNLNG